MRSARRWSATSTCDHDAVTVSFLVTRSFRMATYFPPITSPINNSTTSTITTAFIVFSSGRNGRGLLFFQAVHGVDHDRDLFEIRIQQCHWFQLAGLDTLFPKVEQFGEWLRIDAEFLPRLVYYIPLLHF